MVPTIIAVILHTGHSYRGLSVIQEISFEDLPTRTIIARMSVI